MVKKISKIIDRRVLGFLLTGSGILLASMAFAQVSMLPATVTLKKQTISLCNIVENNVAKRLSNFEDKKTLHVAQYELARTRTIALITKLDNTGHDVSQAKIDLVTFEDKIKKFGNDYASYISDLQGTKTFTCGRSEGEFRAELAIARAQLKVVHDDAVAVRTFWAQTLKPELVVFKSTAASANTVEGSN